MKKRTFIKTSLKAAAGITLLKNTSLVAETNPFTPFTLPKLNFAYNALEPYIDAQTMEIHHSKHHQAYVNNLNKALENFPNPESDIEAICKNISKYPMAVRNNGGGHYNHSFFWNLLSDKKNQTPFPKTKKLIEESFTSFEVFKEEFSKAALSRFGSGWAWMILDENKKLKIVSTANQDNPLMDIADTKGKPILALDVWEHAYYLKYQNKRVDYVNAFFNIINWEFVEEII